MAVIAAYDASKVDRPEPAPLWLACLVRGAVSTSVSVEFAKDVGLLGRQACGGMAS